MKLTFQIWWLSPPGQFLSAVWSAPDARSALWAYLVPQTLLPKPENTHLKHQIYTVNVTQGKLPHTHNMSLTLSMESERHFLWRKRVTSWTTLSNVLLGRLDSSLNLSHRLNWKVIFENTGHHWMIQKSFQKTANYKNNRKWLLCTVNPLTQIQFTCEKQTFSPALVRALWWGQWLISFWYGLVAYMEAK